MMIQDLNDQKSRIKTMLITFYGFKGIVHKEFVPEGETVNGEYYLQVLHRLWLINVRVRPEYPKGKQLFLLHDNAPPHKTKKVNEFFMKKQICIIDYPPYSPDLSPRDYFLSPKLKTALKIAFYDDVPTIQEAVTQVPIENSCIGSFRGSLLGVPCRFLYRIMYENHQDP